MAVRHPTRLRNQALTLIEAGQSATSVARRLGLAHSTVYYWLRSRQTRDPMTCLVCGEPLATHRIVDNPCREGERW